MGTDRDWDLSRNERNWRIEEAGMGALRIALLFGSAMVAIALLVTPLLDQRDSLGVNATAGIDAMNTGSIGTKSSYTIRRSVLQDSPASVCIIRSNGRRSGDC
ncbi:MAG: hypothetical protein AB7P20_16730 [Rhizobiaceae bacterium]